MLAQPVLSCTSGLPVVHFLCGISHRVHPDTSTRAEVLISSTLLIIVRYTILVAKLIEYLVLSPRQLRDWMNYIAWYSKVCGFIPIWYSHWLGQISISMKRHHQPEENFCIYSAYLFGIFIGGIASAATFQQNKNSCILSSESDIRRLPHTPLIWPPWKSSILLHIL